MEYYLDLAWKASEAAIAIDNYIFGGITGNENQMISPLSNSLYEISRSPNPALDLVIAQAIWKKDNLKGKRIDEAKLQAWLWAKELETITESSSEKQKEIRDSCVSLSRIALSYSEPFKSMFAA